MDAQKLWAGLGFAALLLLTGAVLAIIANQLTTFWITGTLGFLLIGAALALAWLRGGKYRAGAPERRLGRFRITDPHSKAP